MEYVAFARRFGLINQLFLDEVVYYMLVTDRGFHVRHTYPDCVTHKLDNIHRERETSLSPNSSFS
jgi:hypothetical protein